MKRAFRNWIIGENNFIESWNEYRRIMLSAQYELISLIVLGIYLILEFRPGYSASYTCLMVGFALIFIALLLHKVRYHCTSSVLLFLVLNVLIFLLGSSEPLGTGIFLFLIPMGLGLFSVFNYKNRIFPIGFLILSGALFGLILIYPFSILPFRYHSEAAIRHDQIINFSIAFPVSIVAIYLLKRINYYNARNLKRANTQLSKLNQQLDRFVYSTSHDLRSPLLSIKGLIELTKNASIEEKAQYLQLMENRVNSLTHFISDMTDYSRNSRMEIVKENVGVKELVNEIWELLQNNPEASRIKFINEIPDEVVVFNDGKRMKVVLSNIIGNAIHHYDKGKAQPYIRIYCQTTDESFSLHVQDNGVGVDPALHEKIFDMFFRGNEKSHGTGLGLYIVKETVAKLSGEILLQSVLSEGSTFSISLPK